MTWLSATSYPVLYVYLYLHLLVSMSMLVFMPNASCQAFSVTSTMDATNIRTRASIQVPSSSYSYYQYHSRATGSTRNLPPQYMKGIKMKGNPNKEESSSSSSSTSRRSAMTSSTSRSSTRAASTADTATPSSSVSSVSSQLSSPTFKSSFDISTLTSILSAALLITSNTVGASMMVLPSLAAGPGLLTSSIVMSILYLIHLFSGLLIADVAINQYESSCSDVPSSFKQFADVNLNSNLAGTVIALVSMFVNMCVLSFDIVRGGQVIMENNMDGIDFDIHIDANMKSTIASIIAALVLTTLVGTQSNDTLSKIASVCCITLFASFTGLILPGLTTIQNPISIFLTTPGIYELNFSNPSFLSSLCTFTPIALMSMVYQNIVPTVTKMLHYDRKQVIPAITLGSLLPMIMYISFCFVEIGSGGVGGTAAAAGTCSSSSNILMDGIKVSSLIGSAMACTMSISQEVSLFLDSSTSSSEEECITDGATRTSITTSTTNRGNETNSNQNMPSLPSVILSVLPPLIAGLYLSNKDGDGIINALSISGSYGTPLLYGIVPVLLSLNQRLKFKKEEGQETKATVVPGGYIGLGLFGTGSVALIVDHLIHDVSNLMI